MLINRSDSEARYRSLLQKAVRRGDIDLVYTTSALLESLSSKDKNWYRTRTAIITFEECWPLGSELLFNRKFYSKVAALVKVTRSMKSRDASGLGYLAYALAEGDTTVLTGKPEDKHLRIVANAIRRPDDFWQWIASPKEHGAPEGLIEWPPGTAPAAKMRDFIEALLQRMLGEREPWQRKLMMREILDPTVACRE